jgi:GntR family phosphonate transport system transcriptional regulator
VLWQQLADSLLQEIASGALPAGSRLPTEMELAARYKVNRHTIRRAVSELAGQGLLSVEQGRGTFVSAEAAGLSMDRGVRFTEIVTSRGDPPEAGLVSSRTVEADPGIAKELEVEAGTSCLLMEALHLVGGWPVNYVAHYYPLPRFAGLDKAFAMHGSMKAALEACGVRNCSRRTTRVSTRLPTAAEAGLLRQNRSKPVLVVETLTVDGEGRPVGFGIGRGAGERMRVVFDT